MLLEEGTSESQQLCEENGVRVQRGSDTREHLEDVRREVGELVTRGAEFRGEGRRIRFGGLWSVPGNEGKLCDVIH